MAPTTRSRRRLLNTASSDANGKSNGHSTAGSGHGATGGGTAVGNGAAPAPPPAVHLSGPGGSLHDLRRLHYDADGESAAAHGPVHVSLHRRRADQLGARDEVGSLALLVLLYMVQGVPLGLTTGALPLMLSSKLSYTQMGIFALASYPYSLKLLWSPIVDSLYHPRLGRRKSWIVPIQLLTAYLLIAAADWTQRLYDAADVWALTGVFLLFVFLMATQDIAVDGWALTLLSPANVSYASTCQTVGQTTGIFTSFTVFLALQDAAFCNKFLRGNPYLGSLLGTTPSDTGLVSLAGYMRFWGWVFAAVTLFIAVFIRETPQDDQRGEVAATAPLSAEDRQLIGLPADPLGRGRGTGAVVGAAQGPDSSGKDAGGGGGGGGAGAASELAAAYLELWRVVRLPAVWRLTVLLLTYRVGVLAAEGAASLKLIDKGVAKEALAFLVLFQFPVELISAVVAGRWAASHSPYWPFMTGYLLRLGTAAATVAVTAAFPPGATSLTQHGAAFGALAAVSLATSFVSYLGFTALGSFFNTISDPAMGGAYLTLLNTLANMGYMLPRTPLFWLMDVLTVPRCNAAVAAADGTTLGAVLPYACPKKMAEMARGSSECVAAGGVCSLAADGYYIVSGVSLAVGVALGLVYLRFVRQLMHEPLESWRAAGSGGVSGEAEAEAAAAAAAAAKRRD